MAMISEEQIQRIIRVILSAATTPIEELTMSAGRADIYTPYGIFEFKNIVGDESDHQATEQAQRYLGTDYVYSFGFIANENNEITTIQGRIPIEIWEEMKRLGIIEASNCKVIKEKEKGYIVVNIPTEKIDDFARLLIQSARNLHVHTFNNLFLRPFYDSDAYRSAPFQIDRKILQLQEKFNIDTHDIKSEIVIDNLFDKDLTREDAIAIQHMLRKHWTQIEKSQKREELIKNLKNLVAELEQFGYRLSINIEDDYELLVKSIYAISALATHSGVIIGLTASTNRNVTINNQSTIKQNLIDLDVYAEYFNRISNFNANLFKAISIGGLIKVVDTLRSLNLPRDIKKFLIDKEYVLAHSAKSNIAIDDIKEEALRKAAIDTAMSVVTAMFRIGDPARSANISLGNNSPFIEIEMKDDETFIISKIGRTDHPLLTSNIEKPLTFKELLDIFDKVYKDDNANNNLKKVTSLAIGMVINMKALKDPQVLQNLGQSFIEHKEAAILYFYNKNMNERVTNTLLTALQQEFQQFIGMIFPSETLSQLLDTVIKEIDTDKQLTDEQKQKLLTDINAFLSGEKIYAAENKIYNAVLMTTILSILGTQAVGHYMKQGYDGIQAMSKLYHNHLIPSLVAATQKKNKKYNNIAKTVKEIEKIANALDASDSSLLLKQRPDIEPLREIIRAKGTEGLQDVVQIVFNNKQIRLFGTKYLKREGIIFIQSLIDAAAKDLLLRPDVTMEELQEWEKFANWVNKIIQTKHSPNKHKLLVQNAIETVYRAKQNILNKQAIIAAQQSNEELINITQKRIELMNRQSTYKKQATSEINKEANFLFQMILLAQIVGDTEAISQYQERLNNVMKEYNVLIDESTLNDMKRIIEKENIRIPSFERLEAEVRARDKSPLGFVIEAIMESKDREIIRTKERLQKTEQQLQKTEQQLQETEQQLQETAQQLQETEQQLQETKQQLQEKERVIEETQLQLNEIQQDLMDLLMVTAEDILTKHLADYGLNEQQELVAAYFIAKKYPLNDKYRKFCSKMEKYFDNVIAAHQDNVLPLLQKHLSELFKNVEEEYYDATEEKVIDEKNNIKWDLSDIL